MLFKFLYGQLDGAHLVVVVFVDVDVFVGAGAALVVFFTRFFFACAGAFLVFVVVVVVDVVLGAGVIASCWFVCSLVMTISDIFVAVEGGQSLVALVVSV